MTESTVNISITLPRQIYTRIYKLVQLGEFTSVSNAIQVGLSHYLPKLITYRQLLSKKLGEDSKTGAKNKTTRENNELH